MGTFTTPRVTPLHCNCFSAPDAELYEVRGHHLLCAVCARGGCDNPPPGEAVIAPLLAAMWEYPYLALRITADVDVTRAHFYDVYGGRGQQLPEAFPTRNDDYLMRRKDLEVLRVLGLAPGGVLPAYIAYNILFQRQPTLDGICRTGSEPSAAWPECPHARARYYETIASEGSVGTLNTQNQLGEDLAGRGIWAMVRPRSQAEMAAAKEASAEMLRNADHLYLRPNHVLCILCTAERQERLEEDNLIELRKRMEDNPDIPVTLTEGCCMVCDPCNVYHPGEHLCYHAHIKNTLRDLIIMEKLGVPPGATMTARELYALVYARIGSLKEICGWRDGSNTAPFWSPCNYTSSSLDQARERGLIAGG